MQIALASGGFISKLQEAVMGNGRLALNPFAWKRIWSTHLLPEQVWYLARGGISLLLRINAI